MLKVIFILLHVVTAAAWFGLGLRLATQARTVASLDLPAARGLADDTFRTIRFMDVFIVLTLVFALGAFFAGGGFSVYPPQYHTSLLLILVLVGLQFGLLRPSWASIRNALAAGEKPADTYRKRLAIGAGIGHLVWLVILVLMFWYRLAPMA